jgi:putative cardiolipin synthase
MKMITRIKLQFYNVVILIIAFSCSQEDNRIPLQEKDFCSSIHSTDTSSLSDELKDLSELMDTKTGVYVLEDGGGSLVTRAWLCEHAEKTIDVQYFIFSTDNVGLIACDYLVRAADRGVKVRIIIDDIMVEADVKDLLTLDSHENISVKIYNPGINLGKNILGKATTLATDFRSANQRMHNKTFTVDGKVVITGGRNIADEYFDYNNDYNFRDRDVLLLGKVSNEVNKSFEEFWNNALCVSVTDVVREKVENIQDLHRFDNLHQYACNPENFWPQVRTKIENLSSAIQDIKKSGQLVWLDSVSFVSDVPGKNDGTKGLNGGGVSTNTLIELVKKSKYSIDIQSPYLITSELGRNLFCEAVKRGVKIRILTNSLASTDNLEAFSGYQKDREKLLKAGIRIYEFRPDAAERIKIMTGDLQSKLEKSPVFGIHAKSMVVDGKITVIGTFNLDPRSANLNTECMAIIYSSEIAKNVTLGMEEEFKPENSWETTLLSNPDSEVSNMKRINTWTKKVLPKGIL